MCQSCVALLNVYVGTVVTVGCLRLRETGNDCTIASHVGVQLLHMDLQSLAACVEPAASFSDVTL